MQNPCDFESCEAPSIESPPIHRGIFSLGSGCRWKAKQNIEREWLR